MTTRPPRPQHHQPPFARASQIMQLARNQIGCVTNADRVTSPVATPGSPAALAPSPAPADLHRALPEPPKMRPLDIGVAQPVPVVHPAPVPAVSLGLRPEPAQETVEAEVAAAAPEPAAVSAAPADSEADPLDGMTLSALEALAKTEGVTFKKGVSRAALAQLIRTKRAS